MTDTLRLDALVRAGERAGLPGDAVRDEGERLAAAVAEGSPGAAADWLAATGHTGTTAFFAAAASARRWRTGPTDLLSALRSAGRAEAPGYADALADVAAAAATLGAAGPAVARTAMETAAAQRSLAPARPAPFDPAPLGPGEPIRGGRPLDLGLRFDGPGDPVAGALPGAPEVADILAALRASGPVPGDGTRAPATALAATEETTAAVEAEPTEPAPTLEEMLGRLDALVGLDKAKSQVHRQVQLLRVEKLRAEAGLTKPTLTRHLVFTGNPGTGKTTVARLVAGIYRAMGLLPTGTLVEVDRSELVAGYLGQTAEKTTAAVQSALGGVLFVDEAYALTQGRDGPDQYGTEAVNTLVKDMEDHRGDLVVIVAGYPGPMAEFVATNPGLESRFSTTIEFEDYSDAQLREIFAGMAAAADFEPTEEALERVEQITGLQPRTEGFGNARFVRNLLDAAISRQAWRLRDVAEPTLDQLRTLLPEDLVDAPAEPTDLPSTPEEDE